MSSNPSSNLKNTTETKTPKSDKSEHRKNTKITGERSEAAFLARAIAMGFGIAKPWGDSRRYDFILDNGECLHRIQVKCTESIRARAYETRPTYTTGKGRAVYTKKDIDFIAAHVVPLDLWYIIPVEICEPAPMLRFYPHRQAKIMRLEPYREAWKLILPKESNHVMDIHASAAESLAELCHSDRREESASSCHSEPRRKEGEEPAVDFPRQYSDPNHLLVTYRELIHNTPITKIQPPLAPWPLPTLKILASRKGKHVLPSPSE